MDDDLAPSGKEWKRIRLPDQGRPEGTRADTRYTKFEQQLFRGLEDASQARARSAGKRRRRWNSAGWEPKSSGVEDA